MRAIYNYEIENDRKVYRGYVFRESTYYITPNMPQTKEPKTNFDKLFHYFFVRPLNFIGCIIDDRFNRVYTLQISRFDLCTYLDASKREDKKSIRSHVSNLFSTQRNLGIMYVSESPKEKIAQKKVKNLEKAVQRYLKKYRRKGYEIPDKIPDDGLVMQRVEKGSLADLLEDPLY